jgi:hypothetical protein
VTPFADRAVDRGLTGVLVALVRELSYAYNGNMQAREFDRNGELADHVVRYLKPCGIETRTLGLGATNGWFAMRPRAFSLPRADDEVDQRVAENWAQLGLLAKLPEADAKSLMKSFACWPDVEPYGGDAVWRAIRKRAEEGSSDDDADDDRDLAGPEWDAFTRPGAIDLPDFTTRKEQAPAVSRQWLREVVLVPRLREVSALYGFTRIDPPEWDITSTEEDRTVRLARDAPTWVPCAQTRGEGIFLRFDEDRIAEWEQRPEVQARRHVLEAAHETWRADRRLPPGQWPGMRYVLLHTFAHATIRELALECGYSAAGIAERIYASSGERPMAGVLLYTAAPDSEGTLGGLVTLGRRDRLGPLIEQALDAARLCSSDPLCAEHDPRDRGVLYGAACHACLFASETSCERGNHYLDRALLVDTAIGSGAALLRQ